MWPTVEFNTLPRSSRFDIQDFGIPGSEENFEMMHCWTRGALTVCTVACRYKATRQADISMNGWDFGRRNFGSPSKAVSISVFFDKWMAFWAADHMLTSRLACTGIVLRTNLHPEPYRSGSGLVKDM